MSNKKLLKKIEDVEDIYENESENEEEPRKHKIKIKKKVIKSHDSESESNDEKIEKPKKKSNYIQTPARKAAFEKAIQKRNENSLLRKQLKEAESEKIKKLKDTLKSKQERKINKIKKQVEEISSDSEVEEKIIIKKKKS